MIRPLEIIFLVLSFSSIFDATLGDPPVNSSPMNRKKLIVDNVYGRFPEHEIISSISRMFRNLFVRRRIVNSATKANATPSSNLIESCHCGVRKHHGTTTTVTPQGKLQRITGGRLSAQQAWPWMAAIVFVGDSEPFWFCGASLINDRYVLTASHCLGSIRRYGISNIRIYLGTNEILSETKALKAEISTLIPHPQYSTTTEDYDIALIKLKSKVPFSERVSPICLTQTGSPFVGRMATVAGWGSQTFGRAPPEALRDVHVKVVPTSKCQRDYYYNYNTVITASMLCAWLPNKDSCQGDSGGPIFLRTTEAPHVYTQIGIVSFGPPSCGTSTIPGVYSRISSSLEWIKKNTKDAKYCSGSF